MIAFGNMFALSWYFLLNNLYIVPIVLILGSFDLLLMFYEEFNHEGKAIKFTTIFHKNLCRLSID